MRIFKMLFAAFLFVAVLAVISFFTARESLLYWGNSKIRKSLQTLSLSRRKGSFQSQCIQLGSGGSGDQVQYQLRFLSDTEYLIEAVCDQFSFDPILIGQEELPEFVTKVPGTSGFVMNKGQSGIEIQVFAEEIQEFSEAIGMDLSFLERSKVLVAENGVIILNSETGFVGNGPVTSCIGYGYECCQDVSHIGVGDKITGLVDCEQSCFSSCASRPIILSFNTDPIMDPRSRVTSVRDGDVVMFTYVADAGGSNTVAGVLDFGDGKKLPVTGLAGQASHTYSCNRSMCEYMVALTLEDNWGVESAETPVSKVKIVVRR